MGPVVVSISRWNSQRGRGSMRGRVAHRTQGLARAKEMPIEMTVMTSSQGQPVISSPMMPDSRIG